MNQIALIRRAKFKRLEEEFKKHKRTITCHPFDLYYSDHFIDRIIDRRLDNDVCFIQRLVKYFMETIFYNSTYSDRNYVLQLKTLKVGISIVSEEKTLSSKHRSAVVKTVFDRDDDTWEFDELIDLVSK